MKDKNAMLVYRVICAITLLGAIVFVVRTIKDHRVSTTVVDSPVVAEIRRALQVAELGYRMERRTIATQTGEVESGRQSPKVQHRFIFEPAMLALETEDGSAPRLFRLVAPEGAPPGSGMFFPGEVLLPGEPLPRLIDFVREEMSKKR